MIIIVDVKKARLTEIVGSEFVNGSQPYGDSSVDTNSPREIQKVKYRAQEHRELTEGYHRPHDRLTERLSMVPALPLLHANQSEQPLFWRKLLRGWDVTIVYSFVH